MRLFLFFLIFLFSSYAHAQQRLALVIGNSDYSKISHLPNPINDASDIAAKLKSLNFKVTLKTDQTHQQMKASIRKFSQNIASGDIALFYYAGHGVQSSDMANYLIPLRADIQSEADLDQYAINADWVLEHLKQASPALKILILDACRNNPFRSFRTWRGSDARGLVRMNSSSGTIIAYAAGAGEKANDGQGRNGLFTAELLKWLGKPNIQASQMFSQVSWKVNKNPEGKGQSPFLAMQAPPPFCFAGCGQTPPEPPEIVDTNSTAIFKPTEIVTPKPTEKISRQVFEPKMKFIKGGLFKMGCVSGFDCRDNEKVHEVSVNDFWIGQYEVTFDEWQNCVNDGGCQSNQKPKDEGWGRGQRPVINVSWHDTNEYAAWLNKKTGKNYRLPTEAEWEYAARAGTNTRYWWGNQAPSCSKKDKNGASHDGGEKSDCYWNPNKKYRGTELVGNYHSNQWGLYDTVGNVWEWTCSAYPKDNQYNGLESKCTNKNDSRSRVLRGGSWRFKPRNVRSAIRHGYTATDRSLNVGFRLSRTR